MVAKEEVTGGDLHNLWKISHMDLPEVENVYIDVTEIHANQLADGDTQTFGKAFTVWQGLQKVAHVTDGLFQANES